MPKAISKETSLPLFADDSKCFQVILGRDDVEKLQDDLNKLFQWSCIWGMEFNAKKCKVLRVARIRSIKNWFMLSVRISSYGCTREVWRARKKRKSCSRRSREQL